MRLLQGQPLELASWSLTCQVLFTCMIHCGGRKEVGIRRYVLMVRSRVLKISYMHSWTLLSWFNAWIRKLLFLPPTHFARIEYRYHPTDSAIESILPYHTHTRIAPVHPEHSFGQQRHAIGKGTSLRPFTSVAHTHTFIFRQGGISPTPRLEEFPSRISEVLASFFIWRFYFAAKLNLRVVSVEHCWKFDGIRSRFLSRVDGLLLDLVFDLSRGFSDSSKATSFRL